MTTKHNVDDDDGSMQTPSFNPSFEWIIFQEAKPREAETTGLSGNTGYVRVEEEMTVGLPGLDRGGEGGWRGK